MRLRLAILIVLLAGAGAARADERPAETRWYGWQIMLTDAVGAALVYFGAQNDSTATGAIGAITLAVAPPLIHLAHHAPGDAGLSLLIRVLPFGASLALFAALHPQCGDGCGELLIPFGGLVLSGVGAIADWAFLSTEQVSTPRVSLAPALPMDRRRGGVGLALTVRF